MIAMPDESAFQSSLVFWGLVVVLVIFSLDATAYIEHGRHHSKLKYLYFVGLAGLTALVLIQNGVFNLYPAYPVIFLALAGAGAVAFILGRVTGGSEGYASALLPLICVGMAAFIPWHRSQIDFDWLTRGILIVMCFACAWYFLPFIIGKTAGHVKSFIFVYTLCLSMLLRKKYTTVLLVVLLLAYLALRPTSSLTVSTLCAGAMTCAFIMGWRQIAASIGVALLAGLLLMPLVYLIWPDAGLLIFQIEPYVKEELLGGQSNNDFRIMVLLLAREEILAGSLLFGDAFMSNAVVSFYDWNPSWGEGWGGADVVMEQAPVHSDLVIFLLLGGLVSYAVFVVAIVSVWRVALDGARMAIVQGNKAAQAFFESVSVSVVVLVIFMSFNLLLPIISHIFYFWLLFLLGAIGWRCLKVRERLAGSPVGRTVEARA